MVKMSGGPVVQSVVSLTSWLRVISLTVVADSIYNILIFFCWKNVSSKSYSHFFRKKFQHICVSLNVNFNKSLTNDVVSFEQLGPGRAAITDDSLPSDTKRKSKQTITDSQVTIQKNKPSHTASAPSSPAMPGAGPTKHKHTNKTTNR